MLINSILDTDLYKMTMQQAICNLYPYAYAEYTFINRGNTRFPEGFAEALCDDVNAMSDIQLTADEKKFLIKNCPYLTPVYIDFLSGYRFDPNEVYIHYIMHSKERNNLSITIRGPWYRTVLWEVPLMAMISERYFNFIKYRDVSKEKNIKKGERLKALGIRFADFGTRRRFSRNNHKQVISAMKIWAGNAFIGTSNLYMAMAHNLNPIGTQAHEWFQFHAAKYGFRHANAIALEKWVDVYQGNLGIALSDTFTSDVFFDAFNVKYAKLFDGVRHDSGNPFDFIDKTIAHYRKLGIDPLSKVIVFSDGLDVDTVEDIEEYCVGLIGTSYGIGTNLTNDVGVKPLNMVIKMTRAKPKGFDWINTVKLSDAHGKWTGDIDMLTCCRKELGIKI